jgi:hypothetical protein
MRIVTLAFVSAAFLAAAPKTTPLQVTYNRDVLLIMQNSCQGCHRPGEAAPMSFLTYKETRPWAKSIREAVLIRKMPPWFADPHVGKFKNDASLTPVQIDTIVKWVDSGAPEGDLKDKPTPREFVDGWNIGKPDAIIEMPAEYEVPASGTIEYTYFLAPTGFTEDRWIQLAEARPGNRAVVHHMIAFIREPGSKWMSDIKPGEAYIPKKGGNNGGNGEWLIGFAPGTRPMILKPGQAVLLKAGSDIIFQMHYTTNGTAGKDRTKIGLIFAKEPPKERVSMLAATTKKFAIPPGDENYRVDSTFTIQEDATLTALIPHMHLRGKDFSFRAVFPTGEAQALLNVPHYSFNWQLDYQPEKPILLPKGTRIECTAHYDNSANNPNNPDPKAEVRYGDQSWEEMMFGFFTVAYDAKMVPADLTRAKKTTGDN